MSSITETLEPEDNVTTQATVDLPVETDRIEEEEETLPLLEKVEEIAHKVVRMAKETELGVVNPDPREVRIGVRIRLARTKEDLQEATLVETTNLSVTRIKSKSLKEVATTSLSVARATAQRLREPKTLATN